MEAVKIELTLNGDVLETLLEMLATKVADKLAAKEESREESTKEESKEETNTLRSIASDTLRINTTNTTNKNNNINNNICNGGVANNTNIDTNTDVSMDKILGYMNQKGYKFDPNRFYTYYKNNGWKTRGGKDIRNDLYAAIDTWASYEFKKPAEKAATTPNKVGMGTREERMAAHPFVPTNFDELTAI